MVTKGLHRPITYIVKVEVEHVSNLLCATQIWHLARAHILAQDVICDDEASRDAHLQNSHTSTQLQSWFLPSAANLSTTH